MIEIVGFLVDLLIVALIFLAIRKVVTWYWKIDDICNLLTKIEENTRKDSINNNKESKLTPLD